MVGGSSPSWPTIKIMNTIKNIKKFLYNSRDELYKVVWPDKRTTINTTIAVVVLSILVSALLSVADYLFSYLLRLVI